MFKILLRMIGAPVAKRARHLAHDFLGQTLRAADVQHELLLRRIAQHADSQFGRDHHFREIRITGRFSPSRADRQLRSPPALHRASATGRSERPVRDGN